MSEYRNLQEIAFPIAASKDTSTCLTCRCRHTKLALEATEYAPKTTLCIQVLDGLSEEQTNVVLKNSTDGKLELYTLPGGNICVPVLSIEGTESCRLFTHIRNGKVDHCLVIDPAPASWIKVVGLLPTYLPTLNSSNLDH